MNDDFVKLLCTPIGPPYLVDKEYHTDIGVKAFRMYSYISQLNYDSSLCLDDLPL